MKTIWYDSIEDVLLNISDPNTWGAISEVPWVSSPKINAGVSVYNVEAEWGSWIAWWSTNVTWSASDYNTVAWWSGSIYLPDWTALSVSSWSTGNMSATTYIYYDMELGSVATTTSASSSVGENKILICVAKPASSSSKKAEFQAFGTDAQSTFITADNIAANTITANEIASNTITANELNVSYLSAIAADLWTITAWDITWTTITAWSTSSGAWVKMYPASNTRWTIDFYYNWYLVWYIQGSSNNLSWRTIELYWTKYLTWGTTYAATPLYCADTLRIPVWTDLYDY